MFPARGQSHESDEEKERPIGDKPIQLLFKGTFIDVNTDDDAKSDLSPRASSDPGSVSSSRHSSHFAAEHAYVSNLSSKWTRRQSFPSSHSNAASNEAECNEAAGSVDRMPVASGSDKCSPTIASQEQGAQGSCKRLPNVSSAVSVSEASCSSSVDVNSSQMMRNTDKMRLHRDELKVFMRKKANEVTDLRLCNALASIQEIPEQVGEVLQQTATDLVDDVSNEVSKARHILAAKVVDPMTSAEVDTQVQEIPDMVMASFEVSFAKAMSNVRVRVDDVLQSLGDSNFADEEVVQQLWMIPEEVRQITREAVKEASEASQDKVIEQLDNVMQNISEEKKTQAVFQAQQNIVMSLPQTLPTTVRRTAEVTQCNVQHATEVINEKGLGDAGYVANRVVADTLLRAKVGNSIKEDILTNPGSSGHPELCSRACLYFPLGKCTNGVNCAFCHGPHAKRASHLDKRHRELLRSMHFMDRLRLILPILKAKFESLESQQELSDTLAAISQVLGYLKESSVDKRRAKEHRTLQTALKCMSARSLAALLYHAPASNDFQKHEAIELLLQKLRPSLSGGSRDPESSMLPSEFNSRMSDQESDM